MNGVLQRAFPVSSVGGKYKVLRDKSTRYKVCGPLLRSSWNQSESTMSVQVPSVAAVACATLITVCSLPPQLEGGSNGETTNKPNKTAQDSEGGAVYLMAENVDDIYKVPTSNEPVDTVEGVLYQVGINTDHCSILFVGLQWHLAVFKYIIVFR